MANFQNVQDLERRRHIYGALSTELSFLSDQRLSKLLKYATPFHKGWGTSVLLEVGDTPIFVKKIPLTR